MESALMNGDSTMVDDYSSNKRMNRKRKANITIDNDNDVLRARLMNKITLSLTKPSFVLGLGPHSIRPENRNILHNLLRKLMRQQNWTEASGVLSMLLKGTLRDRSPIKNRLKYSASMELLKHMGGDHICQDKILDIYDNWIRKIGSMKHWAIEDRFAVRVESILFCLEEGNYEIMLEYAKRLKEDCGSENPMSNMILGLTYRQLWYSTIPEEMQWRDSLQFHSPIQSDGLISNQDVCSVSNSHEVDAPLRCNSDTSVMNDKLIYMDNEMHTETFSVDHNRKIENYPENFEPHDFYTNLAEKDESEASFSDLGDNQHYVSIFSALEGLDPLLLPLKLPHSIEDWENTISLHGDFLNDNYKGAVEYLDQALNSDPPVLVALLPLVQLLLIGGRVDKALNKLEKLCHDSNATLPFRLRAALMEHFNSNNEAFLSTCYEQILKKDPTCCYSLGKLVNMHKKGCYNLESLLEMIALHLDGKCRESDTWKELAFCFLTISQCEMDRGSVCSSGSGCEKKPILSTFKSNLNLFTKKKSRSTWKLRCRWWLTRHFSRQMVASEILDGNLEVLTYKAASACHMYGRKFEYVTKVYNFLKERNCKDLFFFLKTHMHTPIGLNSIL